MQRNHSQSLTKRLTALFVMLAMILGLFNIPGLVSEAQAAEAEQLYTYTISFSHQRSNDGTRDPDASEMKLYEVSKAGNKTELNAVFEVVPGSNNAIRRAVIQSDSPSLTLELERAGASSGAGIFGNGRFVVSAEYPDVYLVNITKAAYYMTWDGGDTITATIVKNNDENMTVYYSGENNTGGKSKEGGTAVPITQDLVPNGGDDTTGISQISLDITDDNFAPGYDMQFKVRSSVYYSTSTSVNSMFADTANDTNTGTGNYGLFTLRRYEVPPTLYTYAIDLFTANGTLPDNTPVLTDMERGETIDATVVDGTNFKRLTFTSEYDKVTVQMSGTGFETEVWGAYNQGDGDKRVALTSEYNHAYLVKDYKATFYVTATRDRKFRLTAIRYNNSDITEDWHYNLRFYYSVGDSAANAYTQVGDKRQVDLDAAVIGNLVPYGLPEETTSSAEAGKWRFGYMESGENDVFTQGDIIRFMVRVSVAGTSDATMTLFSNGTGSVSGSDTGRPKYAEFVMPISEADERNTLTLRVEKDDDDSDIDVIGSFDGNEKVDLSVDAIPGYRFLGWSAEGGGSFSDSKSLVTQYTMPFAESTVIASFKKLYTIALDDATSSITEAVQGERLTITADDKRAGGERFREWDAAGINLNASQKVSNPLSFSMPASDIKLKAIYETISGETYSLTVTGGTATVGGSAVTSAAAGEKVTATAEDKSQDGERFIEWTAEGITLTEAQRTSRIISFIMPAGAVVLTAVHEHIPVYNTYTVDIFNYDTDNLPALYDMTGGGEGTLIDAAYTTSSDGYVSITFKSTSDKITIRAKNSMEESGPFGDGSFVLTADYPRVFMVGGNLYSVTNSVNPLNPPTIIYVSSADDEKIILTAIKAQAGAVSMTYWSSGTGDKVVAGDTDSTPLSEIPELIPDGAIEAKVDSLNVFTVKPADTFTAGTSMWFYVRGDFGNGTQSLFSSSPDENKPGGSNKKANYTVPGAALPEDQETGYAGEGQYTYTIDLFGTSGDIPNLWDMEHDEPISAKAITTWPNGTRRVVMEFNSDYDNITAELYGEGFDGTVWGAYNQYVALTSEYCNAYLESGVPATYYMTGTSNGNLRVTTIRDNNNEDIQFFYSSSAGSINKTVPNGGIELHEQALIPYNWSGAERKITYQDSEEIIPAGAEVWFKVRCQVATGVTRTVFGTGAGDSNANGAKNAAFIMPEYGKVIARTSTVLKYLDDGKTDPSGNNTTSWTLSDLDDSTWKNGAGPFGFGTPSLPSAWGDVTELNGTIDGTSNRVPTYFFRYEFDLTEEDIENFISAYYRIRYKDAVTIYLNGQRIGGHNVPADGYESNLDYGAAIPMSSYGERSKHINVEGLLNEGTNILAVELHQRTASGLDIYLNLMDFVLLESEYIPIPLDIAGLNMQPGSDESQRNFTWQSSSEDAGTLTLWKEGDEQNKKTYKAAIFAAGVTLREGYLSNKTTVNNLETGMKYYYKVSNGDPAKEYVESEIYSFTTDSSAEAYSFLFAADPQIRGVNSGMEEDKAAWQKSLNLALTAWPNISFIVGGGDQVSDADSIKQWDAFLSPDQLRTLPYAPTVGNHDLENYGDDGTVSGLAKYPTYISHFNPSNLSGSPSYEHGGGHYWYTYGDALFVHINSAVVQQHQGDYPRDWEEAAAFIEDAIADYTEQRGEKPAWKIVVMHHAVYASYRSGSAETTELRNSLSDAISALDIDLVLNGHEHNYSRTYMVKGKNTPVTSSSNYIGDPKGNNAGYIKSEGSGETLYVTVSSPATRTNDIDTSLSYVAFGTKTTPMIGKIDVSKSTLTISAYRTNGSDITEAELVDTFTLRRPEEVSADTVTVPTAATGLVYDGTVQTGVAGGTGYTVVNGTATNAGTYTATVQLAEGYQWADGISGSRTVMFTIARKPISIPAAATGLIYNGQMQTGVADGAGYTVVNGTATNAGTYTATVTPDSNHQWDSGIDVTEARQVTFTIAQRPTTHGGTTEGTKEEPKQETVAPLELPTQKKEDGTVVTIVEAKGEYDFTSTKVEGDLEISANGTVIKNLEMDAGSELVIKGKKVVIADSDIKGTISIPGGNANTVTINGTTASKLVVEKPTDNSTNRVRLNISKNSSIDQLYVSAGTKIEITESTAGQAAAAKYTINNVYISVPKKAVVTLSGDFNNVTLSSKKTSLKLLEGKINKLTVNTTATNPDLVLVKGTSITALTTTPKKTSETLTYKSSNRKIAAVSGKGKVKAVKKGSVIVTVTNSNGKSVKCKVTVK